ncbi:transcription initiation factor TFIID subunit 2 isoform X2 [Mercurialis annua]|uniref:transcription initiation factor TFIID subunit 2 isoform X2 n=1 Tax=Mercurialis annua TaxID=3986 RepID=UPI0024ACBF9B|nr:transcription initiation factor TFIID subunit 2 isoform X2 [Mercurialis annua]
MKVLSVAALIWSLPFPITLLQSVLGTYSTSHYEGYLDAKFPFGSYTQIFLAPEVAVSSSSLGASLSIFSAHVLYDERVIDQVIDTSIKLAFALAKQWFGVYVVPEEPNDEWLLDGLAGFLTDLFVKKFLGNNEARYRRYKANCSVCKADESGATTLSSSTSCKDLYGTHCIGIYGKIRSWKSVAILQMLEKQMGPESFRKILQKVVLRARDTLPVRSLSTKEFRHFATKIGNLERPFLKEFFPRWVGACGCPLLRMGFSYNKRKNIVELAVLRECTAIPDGSTSTLNPDSDNRDGDIGWPGMMSIRVYELDGMYDHPVLPLSGEMWQLLEIQCHSKLAARRFQKPKKGTKPDGSDENGDIVAAADMRSSLESPLLWIRADPEMEYLAAIQFNQPIQMWINQLEKDGDVVAQAQAIAALEALPQLSFSVVNSLNNFLGDSKAFWRVRIEAAFALANTASEESDWSGLLHLVKFYKSRRFDATIGLPKPNDFHDFPEYFVLEAIPQAVAMVRSADKKSPREAIEFVLQLLKYNDNTGNPYSDVFWLSALVQSVGQLEFGQQNVTLLSSILKRIDRLLQFDRLMPSYNGILTISCIRTLVQIAFKLYGSIHLEHVVELIKPFQDPKTIWQIRIEASKALLNLEFHGRGIDAALSLFIRYLKEEPTLRGQAKLAAHAMRLCQTRDGSDPEYDIKSTTLVDLLNLLDGHFAYNNIYLRHYLFCILHILAGRLPTLYGVPRDKMLRLADAETFGEGKNIFAALVPLTKVLEPPADNIKLDNAAIQEAPMTAETVFGNHIQKMDLDCIDDGKELNTISNHHEQTTNSNNHELKTSSTNHEQKTVSTNHEQKTISSDQRTISNDHEQKTVSKDRRTISNDHEQKTVSNDQKTISIDHKQKNILDNHEQKVDSSIQSMQEPFKELDTISISHEHKMPVVKIKVKRSAASSRAEEADYLTVERSRGGHNETDRKPSSSVSVDAPQRNSTEAVSASNQNVEEVNSIIDRGSRMTASIGSAKFGSNGDNFGKELQCTADSSKVLVNPQPEDPSSPGLMQDNNVDAGAQKYASLQTLSIGRFDLDGGSSGAVVPPFRAKEKKKKDKEKKRKREEHKGHKDDPEYLERKRLKKEKKRKEKEMSKLLSDEAKAGSVDLLVKKPEPVINVLSVHSKPSESGGSKIVATNFETKPEPSEGNSAPRFRIKIKSRTLTKS